MQTGGVSKATLVTLRGLFAATGVMSGGIVLAACGAVPATAPLSEGEAPAAQESAPEFAKPTSVRYWAYSGFATPDGHGYGIVEALRETSPDTNVRVLPIPLGLGAKVLFS